MKHDLPADPDELEIIAPNQIHVGLEIGTTKICVCVAEGKSDGTLTILGVEEAPSRGVRKGQIVDPVAAAECIRMAIREAEASVGIEIKKVSVAITGSDILSTSSKRSLIVPKKLHEVTMKDIRSELERAMRRKVPTDSFVIMAHEKDVSQLRLREVKDRQETSVEIDCHFFIGKHRRIQRILDCLKSAQLELLYFVPSVLAYGDGILAEYEMGIGVVVIDLGGGTAEYVVTPGVFPSSVGVIAVGGDHITNDISIGLRLPIAKAECLKIQEDSTKLLDQSVMETIILKSDKGTPEYEIDRMSLQAIIHLRVRELFEQIRDEIASHGENGTWESRIGNNYKVVLTGGGSKLMDIASVAEEVFKLPAELGHARNVIGTNRINMNPEFTTAIGITIYAMKHARGTSESLDLLKKPVSKPEPKREFRSNEEYLTALRKERDPRKNLSRDGGEDLDVPTFLRKGTDEVEIKHAKKI